MKKSGASNWLIVVVSWTILLLVGAVAVAPLIPPAPRVDQDAGSFSVVRAFDLINRIAHEPRPIGSPGNERARGDIVAQLRLLGLEPEPELQAITVRDFYSHSGGSAEVVNVLARIPGTEPTKAVALVGHYDTVPGAPGANDDASAVRLCWKQRGRFLPAPAFATT